MATSISVLRNVGRDTAWSPPRALPRCGEQSFSLTGGGVASAVCRAPPIFPIMGFYSRAVPQPDQREDGNVISTSSPTKRGRERESAPFFFRQILKCWRACQKRGRGGQKLGQGTLWVSPSSDAAGRGPREAPTPRWRGWCGASSKDKKLRRAGSAEASGAGRCPATNSLPQFALPVQLSTPPEKHFVRPGTSVTNLRGLFLIFYFLRALVCPLRKGRRGSLPHVAMAALPAGPAPRQLAGAGADWEILQRRIYGGEEERDTLAASAPGHHQSFALVLHFFTLSVFPVQATGAQGPGWERVPVPDPKGRGGERGERGGPGQEAPGAHAGCSGGANPGNPSAAIGHQKTVTFFCKAV